MHGTLTGLVTINYSGTWKNKGKIAVLSNERTELMTKVSMGGKFPVFSARAKKGSIDGNFVFMFKCFKWTKFNEMVK